MRLLQNLIQVSLALFVLLGSTGVYIFEHTCLMDGVDKHLYIPVQHACEMKADVEACCMSEVQSQKGDCCNDEVEVFQIAYEYFHQLPDFAIADFSFEKIPAFYLFQFPQVEENKTLGFTDSSPPWHYSGRQIGIQLQVFRC